MVFYSTKTKTHIGMCTGWNPADSGLPTIHNANLNIIINAKIKANESNFEKWSGIELEIVKNKDRLMKLCLKSWKVWMKSLGYVLHFG